MDRRTKIKRITTVVCLVCSVIALYIFLFAAELSKGWRIVLVIVAISWILTGISNLLDYGKKTGKGQSPSK